MFKPRNKGAGKPPTEAQRKAINRNLTIFRLRGLYFHAWLLTGKRRDRMKALIDAELVAMGAESQTVRMDRERDKNAATLRRWEIIDKLLKGESIS